jgi:hypothetical protein
MRSLISRVAHASQIAALVTFPYHKGGQIPFGESSVVATALVSVMITYRQLHWLAGTSSR